ncbi:hypothetical protein EW146_g8634 [Bondarzewia mesenterica]|uniref:Uncharacterized protein n=1 Tax=Bondarzewia mesenterica TaxID=1095465 RepID=A0A4S4LEK0_9AGAM|nr:hypothetical protein EW146_g8634 [Bondarzewia mesenterica]
MWPWKAYCECRIAARSKVKPDYSDPRNPNMFQCVPMRRDSVLEHDLSLEATNLLGTILAGVAYGIVFALFCISTINPVSPHRGRWVALTLWPFALATICIGFQIRWTVIANVDHRQYPGGPNAYIEQHSGRWENVVLNVFLMPAVHYQMYRSYVIFSHNLPVVIIPAIVFAATVVTGSLSLRQLTLQSGFSPQLADFAVAYRTISLALNVILTLLIIGRLLCIRRSLRKIFPTSSSSSTARSYTSVVAMLIESASLETVTALVYIITVGVRSPLQNVFLPILGQVQVISPLLIVYRVARGRAWSRNTSQDLTQSTNLPVFHTTNQRVSVDDSWDLKTSKSEYNLSLDTSPSYFSTLSPSKASFAPTSSSYDTSPCSTTVTDSFLRTPNSCSTPASAFPSTPDTIAHFIPTTPAFSTRVNSLPVPMTADPSYDPSICKPLRAHLSNTVVNVKEKHLTCEW